MSQHRLGHSRGGHRMKFCTTMWITSHMVLTIIDEAASTPLDAEVAALAQARERLGPFQPVRVMVETVRS